MYKFIQLCKLKTSVFPAILVKMMVLGQIQRSSPEAVAEAPNSHGGAENRMIVPNFCGKSLQSKEFL